MTEEQKREERIQKDAEKFRDILAVPRPGMKRTDIEPLEAGTFQKKGLDLSGILYRDPRTLIPNPQNEYPPLTAAELEELARDIREKGVIVPLIVRMDNVIICGHNRREAAVIAEEELVPIQQILGELTPELERDIMRSENDRRRGGNWTKDEKLSYIKENFGEELRTDRRGGDHGNQFTGGKSSLNFRQGSEDLPAKIEKKSRGRIAAGTAKRLIADIRKKEPKRTGGSARLPEKDRRRAEKLSARLEEIRRVIVVLEKKLANARTEEKNVLKELKALNSSDFS